MPQTDNPHSIRLYESICKHAGSETAERIAHKIPLSKSADFEKKFVWAESICAGLEKEFDEDTVKSIRMDCACGPEMGKIGKLKTLYQSSSGLDDFVEKANKLNQGFKIEYTDGALYLIYPCCYCSCVKRIDKPISKSWCFCTLGYTKKMFEHILGQAVTVGLIESVKTGGKTCRIKVDLA